jgi:phage terminase large subunit
MSSLNLQVPTKLAPFVTTPKRYKVAIGGRGGAKSMTIADILTMRVHTEGCLVGCLREFQNSLDDNVYALLVDEISRIGVPGYKIRHNRIDSKNGGGFRFRGLARSIEAIKSMYGFKIFWLEEAQFISEQSLKILTPTLREEGSELWMSANPLASTDPFSKRFIKPFENDLNKYGFYEDEHHYIVRINWRDNPWFPDVLNQERLQDKKMLSAAMYNHIWEGDFNDFVEDGLIKAEWFDACVDAHIHLGIEAQGLKYAAHDPSDEGPDAKGFAYRHGIVVEDVRERDDGDINMGCDWAVKLALHHSVDAFSWDADGMGVGLKRQVTSAFDGKHTVLMMFKGSKAVDNPDAVFEPVGQPLQNQITNKDALANQRAQYYLDLRRRIYKTYEAVTKGVYHNPDDLISFSSGIELIPQLRSELCLMPIKPVRSGKFELFTKNELKTKFKFKSPNLADSVMMLCKDPPRAISHANVRRPQPIKPVGIRPKVIGRR